MKERLIGAAVLVALAVWLIPWVLDGPESVLEMESEALELPAARGSTPVRTQTIRLDERRDPPTPAAGNGPTEAPDPSPARESSARTVDPPPVEEQENPRAAQETAPPSAGGWMIQLGSFSEEDNARRLADRVATFGFSARVSTFTASGRTMYRVRVGPEPSRERAVAVASSLSAHGFVAQVVSQD